MGSGDAPELLPGLPEAVVRTCESIPPVQDGWYHEGREWRPAKGGRPGAVTLTTSDRSLGRASR